MCILQVASSGLPKAAEFTAPPVLLLRGVGCSQEVDNCNSAQLLQAYSETSEFPERTPMRALTTDSTGTGTPRLSIVSSVYSASTSPAHCRVVATTAVNCSAFAFEAYSSLL